MASSLLSTVSSRSSGVSGTWLGQDALTTSLALSAAISISSSAWIWLPVGWTASATMRSIGRPVTPGANALQVAVMLAVELVACCAVAGGAALVGAPGP